MFAVPNTDHDNDNDNIDVKERGREKESNESSVAKPMTFRWPIWSSRRHKLEILDHLVNPTELDIDMTFCNFSSSELLVLVCVWCCAMYQLF